MTRASARDARDARVESGKINPTLDWQCPYCRRWYSRKRGAPKKHLSACQKHPSRVQHSRESSAELLQYMLDSSPTPPRTPPLPHANSSTVQDARSVADPGFMSQKTPRDVHVSREEPIFPDPTSEGPSNAADSDVDMQEQPFYDDSEPQDQFDPYTYPLEPGQTLVVPHPHAGILPYTVPTVIPPSGQSQLLDQENTVGRSGSLPPWHPFPSLEDFEQTEIFVDGNAPDPRVNKQLSLIHRASSGSKISLKNAVEMHAVLAKAADFDDLEEFKTEEIKVAYKTSDFRTYTLRFRDAMPAIMRTIEDQGLLREIQLYPEKRYVLRKDGKSIMRVINEAWTADDWHELQTTVGPEKIVIYYCIYADATQLNAFGTQKAWPVYIWISNIPKALRRGKGKGRAILLGFLPNVPGQQHDDGSHLAVHRAAVYHAAMKLIFESVEFPAECGTPFVALEHDGTLTEKEGVPVCAVASMDMEERDEEQVPMPSLPCSTGRTAKLSWAVATAHPTKCAGTLSRSSPD
ncbi:hypothetical protein EIP86_007483 [Pleurotus ostreatoroseus]|nr:hypothetical protein EIP86_007483 [Pleurotus ostreatoroseus]